MCGACVALLAASPAFAAHKIETGFADSVYLDGSDTDRAMWLDKSAQEGAGIVRANVVWSHIVASKPLNPRDPADPGYDFSSLDAFVRAASARGLQVLLTVYDAPGYAEGKHRPGLNRAPAGTWKPKPGAFGDFAHALAERYSGSYPTPINPLPRVRFYEAWNEPNLNIYLTPQWHHRRPESPRLYRRLLNAFYGEVKGVVKSNKVIGGVTAPFGDPPGQERMRPLRFLRGLFCLKGKRLRASSCPTKPHLDALSHHPIDRDHGPRHHAINPDDVTVPDLGRVRRVVRAAKRHHTVKPRGSIPLWATEFWWETDPPDPHGVSPRTQARWIEQALYLFWKAGATVALNLQVRDAVLAPSTYQTGVFFHGGNPKPSATSFGFPFVTERRSKRTVRAWGKSPATGTLVIERRRSGGWQTVKTLSAEAGRVFLAKLRLRGGAKLRARVGSDTSLAWHQGG